MAKFIIITAVLILLCTSAMVWAETLTSTARDYVVKNYSMSTPLHEISFDLAQLKQIDEFAVFSSPAYYPDGFTTAEQIEDLVYVLCLKQDQDKSWHIVYDLSRSDVPSDEELKEIKSSFPADFPKKLLSLFWQQLLK